MLVTGRIRGGVVEKTTEYTDWVKSNCVFNHFLKEGLTPVRVN